MVINITDCSLYQRDLNLHEKIHAKYLDKKIGFRIQKIENKLTQKYRAYDKPLDESNKKQHFEASQTWIGLHPQALQTPYNDIFEVFSLLKNESINSIIDIGAGYGRIGIVMNAIFPNASFLGYEILKIRASEGNRIFKKWNLDNCLIENKNVLEDAFIIPEANIYFIYDFSEQEDINIILKKLSKKKSKHFLILKGERTLSLLNKHYQTFWKPYGFSNNKELNIYSSINNTQE